MLYSLSLISCQLSNKRYSIKIAYGIRRKTIKMESSAKWVLKHSYLRTLKNHSMQSAPFVFRKRLSWRQMEMFCMFLSTLSHSPPPSPLRNFCGVCRWAKEELWSAGALLDRAGHNTDSRFISSHKQSLFAVYWGPFPANFVGKINKGRCVLFGSWCG